MSIAIDIEHSNWILLPLGFPYSDYIKIYQYLHIYIYSILGPVKPELGVIPSGQEILVFLSKRSEEVLLIFFVFLEISKMRNRIEINL